MNIDVTALKAVERERGIPADTVLEAIESALVTAYRHADGAAKHVRVRVYVPFGSAWYPYGAVR